MIKFPIASPNIKENIATKNNKSNVKVTPYVSLSIRLMFSLEIDLFNHSKTKKKK